MKKISRYFILIFIFACNYAIAQESNIVPGNIIVMFHSDIDPLLLCDQAKSIGNFNPNLKVVKTLSAPMHIYLFEFDTLLIAPDILLNALRNNPFVKIAQFNHIVKERKTPNDPKFPELWNMNNTGQYGGTTGADISAKQAWNITTGGLTAAGDTIVVAVIDGGFDLTNQELTFWKNYHEIPYNNIDDDNNGYVDDFRGWNPGTGDDSLPIQNHGTHIVGVIGAKGNNNMGIAGINWNVKIMPVCTAGGNVESDVVAGYSYVMEQRRMYNQTNGAKGAFVVSTNSSFGLDLGQPVDYPLWCAMYDSLGSVGILNAGATANANINVDTDGDIPSACPSNWLITVTNTTDTDTKAIAGFGAITIDLGAPGSNIISTGISNTYSSLTGTSIATPHVAGAVALMYATACSQFMTDCKNDPAGIALMVKDSLLGAVDKIPALSGITVTGGRLNLYKSVKAIKNHYFNINCSVVVAVNENEEGNSLLEIKNVYPNPTDNILNIDYLTIGNIEFIFTTVLGQEVKRFTGNNNSYGIQTKTLDLSTLEKGIYFLSIQSNDKKSNVVKVVVY